jgi:hypothetical protein
MTTETILRKTAFIAALAALTSGCQGFGAGWGGADSGPGYETSFSCHADNGHDIWNMGEFTAPATRTLNADSGVGAGGCRPFNDPFDDGATLGLAGDSRQLPDYAYLYWSWVPKGTDATMTEAQKKEFLRIVRKPPTYWARVPVRSQIPESVVKEVEASPMSKQYPYMRNLDLRLYFIWLNDGVQMSWRVQNVDKLSTVQYGGYIPQPLLPRVVENLKEDNAQYVPPPPGALPSLGVAQRMPAPAPAPTPASTPAATPAPTPPAIPKQTP